MRFLAKLREFRDGMIVTDYLKTEMRQNLMCLEDFMRQKSAAFDDPLVMTANPPDVADFNTSPVIFSLRDAVLSSGEVLEDFYFPKTAGKYFIQYDANFVNVRANNVPSGSMNLFAISSQTGELLSINALCSYSILNNVVVSNPFRVGIYADLSPDLGVGFKGESLNLGLAIQNLNIKITKVG